MVGGESLNRRAIAFMGALNRCQKIVEEQLENLGTKPRPMGPDKFEFGVRDRVG
jgi:hypothetical protein